MDWELATIPQVDDLADSHRRKHIYRSVSSLESQGRFRGACTGTLDSPSREFRMSPYNALLFFFEAFESFMIISFGVLDPM